LPAVVLVRPSEEGNVGAVARAMANMGLRELVLIEPAAAIGATARAFAVGASAVLDGARREPSLHAALRPYRRVVGTTSARGRRPGVPPRTARELPELLAADPPGTPTALVFGPERSGLDRGELALCGLLVTIPASAAQPTLNLAQAVLIVAYELALARGGAAARGARALASAAEIDGLFAQLEPILERVRFARDATYAGVARDLRALVARAAPTAREVRILRGICRRVGRALGR
jgi:TrmH family RNA methyltransferase